MSLKQRINSGGVFTSAVGISLLDSLWNELVKEWADPDMEASSDWDAAYCVGLAYAIAKIMHPYVPASERMERVLDEARGRVAFNDDKVSDSPRREIDLGDRPYV